MTNIDQQLAQLETSGLISVATLLPDLEYLFRHALVQDVAYDSLLRQDRRKLHREVAQTLERVYRDRLDEMAARLATHYQEAGQDTQALVYFTRAAKRATRQYANHEAAAYYEQAIQLAKYTGVNLTDLTTLYMAWGRMLELANQHARAYDVYEQLEALGKELGAAAPQISGMAAQALLNATPSPLMNIGRAVELGEQALALAHQAGDRTNEARILWILMLANYFALNLTESAQYGEQSLALCRELNLNEQLAYVLGDISRVFAAVGRMKEAVQLIEEAVSAWRALGNLTMLSDALNTVTEIHTFTGNYALMIEASNESVANARMIGSLWSEGHGVWGNAIAHMERGEYGPALEAGEYAYDLVRSAGLTAITAVCAIALAGFYGELGNPQLGLDTLQDGMSHFDVSASIFYPWVKAAEARLAMQLNDLERVRACLNEVRHQVDMHNFSTHTVFVYAQANAMLHLAEQDYAGAIGAVDPLLQLLQADDLWGPMPELLRLRARALMGLGRIDEAIAALSQGREIAERIGASGALWPLLHMQAEIAAMQERAAEAAALLDSARSIIQQILASLGDHPHFAQSFASLPSVRAVLDGAPA